MARWARMSNIIVREIIDQDPAGRFTTDITWIPITPATTVGGDINAVAPRWTYLDNIFYPPYYGNAVVYIQSATQFSNVISFTGNAFINAGTGQIDESCWLQLAVVNISATNTTAHFVSYSSHVFDVALNAGNTVVYINSPIGSYNGNTYYAGEALSEHSGGPNGTGGGVPGNPGSGQQSINPGTSMENAANPLEFSQSGDRTGSNQPH
jgi:hypothetical protein